MLKIEKCENEKTNSEYTNTSVIFRLSLRCSLGCFCGGHYASSQNTAFWSWSAGWRLGLYSATGTKRLTLYHFASYILSFVLESNYNINKWANQFALYLLLLARELEKHPEGIFLFVRGGSLPLFTFFSSKFISWYSPYTRNAISGFRWGITVITCSSFPILWDQDMTSKCSKLLLPLPWELLPFQTVAINY